MIKYVSELNKEQLNGKKVLMRVDFNIAVDKKTNAITEDFKVKSHKGTVDYLVSNGAKVMLISHITDIDSFLAVAENVGAALGQIITIVPHSELGSIVNLFQGCPVLLLDNIRQDAGEKGNSPELAAKLANGFDLYVNDAFAESHRDYTSMTGVAKLLPSYGGLLLKKEIQNLSQAVIAPAVGKTVVLGGAKISTKIPVIKNFLDKAEKVLIGGAIANNFFKQGGFNIGVSLVDETEIKINNPKIITPSDIVVTNDKTGKSGIRNMGLADIGQDEMIVDIGPHTTGEFMEIIEKSKMVVWNGPMGLTEVDAFSGGTRAIAQAVAKSGQSIIGGGDTIAAVDKLGLMDKYSFISTGGGAMLEFLSGNKLPGLEALGYYN